MTDNRGKGYVDYPVDPYYNKPYQPYGMYPSNPTVNYNQCSAPNPYCVPNDCGGYPAQATNYGNPQPITNPYNVENLPEYSVDNADLLTTQTSVSIRHAFVRKVYMLMATQLAITFGIVLAFTLVHSARDWLVSKFYLLFICLIVAIVLICVLSFYPSIGRRYPINLILLYSITICLSIVLSYGAAKSSSLAFAAAAGMTLVLTIGISIFAIQTKWDFTGCSSFVFMSGLLLILFGILAAIFRSHILHMFYAFLGAGLFSFYLIYDTQMVVGGKHRKYQYFIDDYVPAALTLYMDIINIFIFMLTIFSSD